MSKFLIKRIKSKTWWVATISNMILLGGYFNIDLTKYIGGDWQGALTIVFALLIQLGVTVDTSTKGIKDNDNTETTDSTILNDTSSAIQVVNPSDIQTIGQVVESKNVTRPQ